MHRRPRRAYKLETMRRSALLAAILVAAAGCGGSSSQSQPSACTLPKDSTPTYPTCQLGQVSSASPASIHLGQLSVGTSVTFDVPPNTASVTIVEQAVSAPESIQYQVPPAAASTFENTVVPLRVTAPGNRVVYDDTAPIPAGQDPLPALTAFSASPSPGVGTLTIPNTTAGLGLVGSAGLPSGTWNLVVSDLAYECATMNVCCAGGSKASTYDVWVITKPTAAGSIPTSGKLDVVLWFATNIADLPSGAAQPIDATLAPSDPDVQRMLGTLGTLLSNAGITVGTVAYQDVKDRQASNLPINADGIGGCSDLASLFRNAANGNALNVFFVNGFNTITSGVVGVDGTIPGPSTIAPSGASGVAVSTEDLRAGGFYDTNKTCPTSGGLAVPSCGADLTGYVIAHETGHYLGLYHTTEAAGTSFDTLSDTAICPCSSCRPPNATAKCADASPPPASGSEYQMTIADCTKTTSPTGTCGGGDNLMFYVVGTGAKGTLSPDQGLVMRANPLVQ